MENNLKNFEIDKFNLDTEAVRQASLYEFYATRLADAKEAKDRADNKLELLEAQTQLRLREEFAAKGVKVTESIVGAAVICDQAVIEAKEALVQATKAVNTLQAAVTAMSQKCEMIGVLQRMQSNRSYNMEPTFDGKGTLEYAEKILNQQLNSKG